MMRKQIVLAACTILGMFLIASCSARPAIGPAMQTPATPAKQPASQRVIGASSARPTATPGPLTVSSGEGAPPAAVSASLKLLTDAGVKAVVASGEPDIEVTAQSAAGDVLAYERILVPVDRFPSTLESVTSQEIRDVWSGRATSPGFTILYPSQDIAVELEGLLGPAGPHVEPQAPEAVDGGVWGNPMSIGIVPFDALTPRLRSLALDGVSVVDSALASSDWPLASRAWLHPRTERGRQALARAGGSRPATNRDLDRLTTVAMTGVTAITRNTAVAIEQAGDTAYPARLVGPGLAEADLTITSNEVSFVEGCVADNSLGVMLFCSKPEYFATLELSGVDAIGLTGNHLNDFGYEDTLASLEFYKTKGMPVYGGGIDEEAAREPLILEDHGNRMAFVGANQFGPAEYLSDDSTLVSAWAGPDHPGAAVFDRAQMIADIESLKSRVDVVFAEVQHTEFNAAGDYQIEPLPEQLEDFQALKDAGADVVTGVQAHVPQAVELRGDGVILYGLGNLYFDQTWSWPTSTGLVAWHTIYEGRLLNTHLAVTVIDPDFQLRWATPQERQSVLQSIYGASVW